MKFDSLIIGGGLSGLTSGIRLAEQGKKCAILSSGQSALHFFSGSFDLLGRIDNQEVKDPVNAMLSLPDTHPYKIIGIDKIVPLANEAYSLLQRAGLKLDGNATKNHYVLTSMGTLKTTWLTLNDFNRFGMKYGFPWQKAVIVNFHGFLDFHVLFAKAGLLKLGVAAEIKHIGLQKLEALRRNPSEMRSTTIAKIFDKEAVIHEFVTKVNELSENADVVVLPAVFGLYNTHTMDALKKQLDKTVILLPVVPPSVPGIRSQILLQNRFQQLGGMYFPGDIVENGTFKKTHLLAIHTKNHGNIMLEANHFVLASGSFYSKGLVATQNTMYEPIFGLDVVGDTDRSHWVDENFFNSQPFMSYGVRVNQQFQAMKDGQSIENLYVAGSLLCGANSLHEGSGAGISLLTSLYVSEQILTK